MFPSGDTEQTFHSDAESPIETSREEQTSCWAIFEPKVSTASGS